jgi:hypothetical protein
MRKVTLLWMMVLWFLVMVTTASPSLAAYSSHQNDGDVNNFLAIYPFAKSTKLDDCSLCHPGGGITTGTPPNTKTTYYGSCDYCHRIYGLQPPHGPVPLNPYGQAYKDAGRNQDALGIIKNVDSDGDGYPNLAEIQALTFPGNAGDYPGLVAAPAVGLNLERILKLPGHTEFLLLNASNSRDFYARYTGVKMIDLLKYAGLSNKATQITVFSPDGFSQTFPIDAPDPQTNPSKPQYDVMGPYPNGTYYGGLDFVDYGIIPSGIESADPIPDMLYMLLAYMRDGDPLTPGKTNPTTSSLDGEGPYRLIPPQKIAGSPDRSCKGAPVGDGWDCDKNNKEHNAGFSARTVTAIRVDPLPAGTTDFNWYEGGWNLVDKAKLVIYGAINPRTYSVVGKVSDSGGKGMPDVSIAFSLLSLGNVGEATTSSASSNIRRRTDSGRFEIGLPAGEYAAVPSKEGCTFTPASSSISLPDPQHAVWDWRSPDYELNFTATCVP